MECSHVPIRLAYNSFEPEAADWSSSPQRRKSPIIFMHGLTSCKETWADIPQIFANELKRKAYTVDARNHGDSGWSDVFTTDNLVNDLLFFMDAVDADRAILIGHSMGGTVAIQMALEAPERVELIVVEEMFVSRPPSILLEIPLMYIRLAPVAVQLLPREVDEMEATHFIMEYVNKALPPELADVHSPSKVDKSTMALKRTPDGRFALKANMPVLERSLLNPRDTLKQLQGSFNGPALFVYGIQSPFQITLDEENIKSCFPNALLVGIKDAKHTVHSDNVSSFIDTVLSFLVNNTIIKNRL
ncbi:hypothetical protein CDAR_370241 [Caerostris darwini]|uniref:sn-1-specific diacylglycerol lipase ABHD11 n=1 Tax=Caerostris darwini TaxID=1538125 RepID=A0AAV4W6J9_9ARAC|nr:hypothetical protein CDAR_370241 [Caerostris darwini]